MLGKMGIAAGVAVLFFVIMITAAAGAIAALLSGGTGSPSCTPANARPAGGVAGYEQEQVSNAATIVAVGKKMNVGEQGWIVALATAIQESGLRNLDYGDRDSLGLFQQRPSQGWGSPQQIMDPAYSSTQFYRHLLDVPGWQQMSINDAAQTVQQSGVPDAYGRHEPAARQLLRAVQGSACTGTPAATWTAPAQGTCTSGFGTREGEFHAGQDIAAPTGSPIVAASSGTVVDSGPASGYGLWVRIQHPGGVVTTYGHNNSNLVRSGQEVRTGQAIAEVGNRGQSTGPHLHFQIEAGGQPIDPISFYRQRNAPQLCREEP